MDSCCKEQFDRINRIIRTKEPSAEGRFTAGDKKSNKSCKSCLTKIRKTESIQLPNDLNDPNNLEGNYGHHMQ
jgi:hypothetical protein